MNCACGKVATHSNGVIAFCDEHASDMVALRIAAGMDDHSKVEAFLRLVNQRGLQNAEDIMRRLKNV